MSTCSLESEEWHERERNGEEEGLSHHDPLLHSSTCALFPTSFSSPGSADEEDEKEEEEEEGWKTQWLLCYQVRGVALSIPP